MSREVEYEPEYKAWQYPPRHPYFIYMADKYQKIVDALQVGLIPKYRSQRLVSYISELEDDYIWSDDEEPESVLRSSNGMEILAIRPRQTNVLKHEIIFIKHDLEELVAKAFKPSRVFYSLSLDPDYEY